MQLQISWFIQPINNIYQNVVIMQEMKHDLIWRKKYWINYIGDVYFNL